MTLTAHEVRAIAVEARRDPRSVRQYLRDPASVKSTTRASVEDAMKRLGFRAANDIAPNTAA